MSSKTSRTSDGGHRVTTTIESRGALGEDASYVRTVDYDRYGNKTGETVTNSNGDVYRCDSTGRTVEKIANDGRNDD